MTAEKRAAIKKFIETWKDRGDEKQDTQSFWLSLLRNIYDIADPASYIEFEKPVQLSHQSYIDGYIQTTRVLIEQKGAAIDLSKGQKQSDGSFLTPFGQARRYAGYLPHELNPRWIVVCNFTEFQIHDMNRPNDEPQVVKLEDLEKEYHRMNFLVDTGDENTQRELHLSIAAGELVGELYDALLAQYKDPEDPETLRSLNMLCVRLVFCLYAEDAGVFGRHNMFHDYLKDYAVKDVRRALLDLFEVLNTPEDERDPYMDEALLAFPYVNGGLFADNNVVVPRLDEHIVEIILKRASADFDWSEISPTIFGAVFESTLNPETRRSGGMHYTSIENIHKVIDPLFLDELRDELNAIKQITVEKKRNQALEAYQDKLASLTFLDPACGSGNFLTETYISLRRLENDALRLRLDKQISFGAFAITNPVRVNIGQFYGIEINDFAVTVARTALWIAESQMLKQTEDIIHTGIDFLPLKSYVNITEGNALRIDWESVVPKDELDYIMGNPPFVGYAYQSKEQKDDLKAVAPKAGKNIDYVAGWYFKAAQYMIAAKVRTAFVSTNSITQGEQVVSVWKPIYDEYDIHIDFAHRTFIWDSEANDKAHVHCVIVGFSIAENPKNKMLYTSNTVDIVDNINAYLVEGPNVFIERRTKPLCSVPAIYRGSQPTDNGNLILTKDEMATIIQKDPSISKYIRPFMMGKDFINRSPRYCFWLEGKNPAEWNKYPEIVKRVQAVREYRLSSKKIATQKKADTPMLFDENHECQTDYVAIPKVSSERRKYIPMDYLPQNVIAGDKLFMMPNSTLYHFGVLTSNIHMAWMRAVAGRLKSDYSYSNTIVYNNFPWPNPTDVQRAKIEETAQAILDARALYPDASLADLYDEVTMPPELRKAHQNNDRAVMAAYGITKDSPEFKSESACVAMLMRMYQALTEKK